MPFIRCCVCAGLISENAQTCPKCGDPHPHTIQFLMAKIFAILRECRCPIGQNSLDEACDVNERTALYHEVCEMLVASSILNLVENRQSVLHVYFQKIVPFNLPRMITHRAEAKSSEHNFMIHALSRYFFDETHLDNQDVAQHREDYFLKAIVKAPYYFRGGFTDSNVGRSHELEEMLLDL